MGKIMGRKCIELDGPVVSNGFFDSFDYVLTDCDGVLWMGNIPIPGSAEGIKALKNLGKNIIYVTNNSSKCRAEYLEKLEKFGFPADFEDIFSTSYCAAAYLSSKNFKKKVYVLGTAGVSDELDRANISHLPIGPDPIPDNWIQWLHDVKLDPDVGGVVVAFDHNISYPKLTKAASYLRNPDTLFIGTNIDEEYPTEHNLTIPADGTLVRAVEVVSGRKATNLGKPDRFMLDCIKKIHPDIDFERCIMIGDRLNTDIVFGTKHGLKTCLVLTGMNSLEDVRKFEKSPDSGDQLLIPDYYLNCLGDMKQLIKKRMILNGN